MNPRRGEERAGATLGVQVQVRVSEVEVESLRDGFEGGGGRREGLVRWKAILGFVGDSTQREPERDVEPDRLEATQV